MILAGGPGTRLRPLTLTTPKPLLPVAGTPLVVRLIDMLAAAGIERVLLSTYYRAADFPPVITQHAMPASVETVIEPAPLGTGGALRHAIGRLRGENVLVLNGDSLSRFDLSAIIDRHVRHSAVATIAVVEVDDVSRYGAVQLDRTGRIATFNEKAEASVPGTINAGCYLLHRSAIERIPEGRPVWLEAEILPALLAAGETIIGHLHRGYWRDIGTLASYVRAGRDLVLGRVDNSQGAARLTLGPVTIDADAHITGGTTLHPGVTVAAGARIEGSVVMHGARVDTDANVLGSVIAAGAVVESGALVVDSAVGEGARVGARARLTAGAAVWPGLAVPAGTTVPGVQITSTLFSAT